MVHSEKNNFWSFLTFRGGGGPDQGSENSELFFFFRMNPSLISTLKEENKIFLTKMAPG